MAQGLTRQVQADFSGGMYRNGPPELIPANGAYDIMNGLLELNGGTYRRGGASYCGEAFGAGLRFIWDGWLASGQTTLIASTSAFGKLVGTAVTNLGGSGLTKAARPAVYEGKIYVPGGFTYDGTTVGSAVVTAPYYAIAGNRLLAGEGSRMKVSHAGKPDEAFEATDFHAFPGGVEIIGIEGLRSSAAVFTTGGLWIVSGLQHNLTDEAGNPLRTQDLYSQELVLWGSGGIAAWEGALIVPGTEGVYLVSLGVSSEKAQSFVRISDPIVDLYQEYVHAGYAPGQATVYKNHYLLPIVTSGDVIDLLVCRLDLVGRTGARAWTHLQGAGAKVAALTTRVASGFSRSPELLGALYSATNSRAVNLNYFIPSANTESEQDGTIAEWGLTTRAYTTGNLVPNTVTKLRARYQLAGPTEPKLRAESSSENESPPPGAAVWGGFAWGVGKWVSPPGTVSEALEPEAPPSHDGAKPYAWHPRKKVRYIRFRFSCAAATTQLALRSLEVFVRPDGRL